MVITLAAWQSEERLFSLDLYDICVDLPGTWQAAVSAGVSLEAYRGLRSYSSSQRCLVAR